jgi:OPT family oligopeptide transporter
LARRKGFEKKVLKRIRFSTIVSLMEQDLNETGNGGAHGVTRSTLEAEPAAGISDADLDLPVRGIKGTPEEIERQWFEKIYTGRGDRQKQLTVRAVLMGGILGMFMSISNLYTTLKLGWSFAVTITACVLSYVIWNAVRALSGGRLSQMTMLENNCMQSTASAAGYSTGGTVGVAFGALLLIQGTHQPWYVIGPFVLLTAGLGVFLAIPLKRQMVNQEQLKFPTGIASAETLRSLYSKGTEALRKAYALLISLIAGGVVGLLRSYGALLEQLRNTGRPQVWLEKIQGVLSIPDTLDFPRWLNPLPHAPMAGLALEPSVLLIGAGMITGLRVSLSMLFGSVVLYYLIAPQLLSMDLAHAGVAGYVKSFTLNSSGGFNPTRWALWGGTSIMVFSSLANVALQWRTLARAFTSLKKERTVQSVAMDAIEVPSSWLIAGLIPISLGMVVVQYLAFHISIFLGVVSVSLSFVVSLVCCRATGETDTTPIGAMGKLTQLLYAVLPGAKGIAATNLMAAGVTAGAGGAAADLLTDLKSGYILGANPRKQFLAQFFGIFFGTLAIVPAWYAMVPTKKALEAFNPPATNMWKAVADLLTQGIHMLPATAVWAIVIGAILGVLLPLAGNLFPKAEPYLPSAMGLGLSWVMPFQNTLSFAIGAVLVLVWKKINQRTAGLYYVPVASGMIAGESLVAALIAIACTLVGLIAVAK